LSCSSPAMSLQTISSTNPPNSSPNFAALIPQLPSKLGYVLVAFDNVIPQLPSKQVGRNEMSGLVSKKKQWGTRKQ
jgi:hypothetical protein